MKNSLRLGLATLVAAAAALTGAATADAQSSATKAPASTAKTRPAKAAVSHSAAVSKSEQRRITKYWTKKRMLKAKSGDTLLAGRAIGAGVAAGPATAAKGKKPQARAGGSTWTGGGLVAKTTGKVFFTLDGTDYVCSGSATASTNKDLVTTAGHCVNEGPGDFATNWAFVPGYKDGNRPYGTFTARILYTTSAWANSGDFDYDAAFAVMNTLNGKHLTDVVGSQAIAFNQGRGKYMYAFGYPAASPYTGEKLTYCYGTVFNDTWGDSNDIGMNCPMTGGSSGGPWFYNFNTSTGVGTINSVTSFGYTGLPGKLFGPYFGNTIKSVYDTAKAA